MDPLKSESNLDHGNGAAPWLKAALAAGIVLAILEVISNLLPVIGFVITEPFNIIGYYCQGVLAAYFASQDALFTSRRRVFQAARSGLATGIVLAIVFTIISYAVLLPATLGGAVAALPFSLLNSLMDITLNVAFASLGAWLYGKMGRSKFVITSTAVMGCSAVIACLLAVGVVILLGVLGYGAFKDLIHLPFLPTPVVP
jgi:hypothetical protein